MTTPPADNLLSTIEAAIGTGAYQIGGGDYSFGQDFNESIVNTIVNGPAALIGVGITDIGSAIANLGNFLLTLPLDVLKRFQAFMPGVDISGFINTATAVETILSNLLLNPLGSIVTVINQIIAIFSGEAVTPISDGVQQLKDWFSGLTSQVSGLSPDGELDASRITGLIQQSAVDGLQDISDAATAAASNVEDTWNKFVGVVQGEAGAAGKTIADFTDSVQNFLDVIRQGADGTAQTGSTAADVANTVGGLRAGLASVNAQMSDLTAQSNAVAAGNKLGGSPTTAVSSGWGSSWTLAGAGSVKIGSDLTYQWIDSGNTPRQVVGRYNVGQTLTDYQLVRSVLASSMEYPLLGSPPDCGNAVIGRMNSSGNTYVYARAYYDHMELGCYVSGTKHVFATASMDGSQLGFFSLEAGTASGLNVFNVYANNNILISYTDTAGVSQVGASYRYGGQGMYSDTRVLGESTPGRVQSWILADNSPTATLGTGLLVSRANTSTVTFATGDHTVPNSFFDTVNNITMDISWAASTNTVTIGSAGWYLFTLAIPYIYNGGANINNSDDFNNSVIYKNGVPFLAGGQQGVAGDLSSGIFGTWTIYCAAGDTVSPGYHLEGSNMAIGGGGSPSTYVYFSGAKLSP